MKQKIFELRANAKDQGKRIDLFLAENHPGQSRSRIQKLISEKKILVNEKTTKPGYRIKANDKITVEIPPLKELKAEPQKIPINIVYEDKDILVVNKKAGMVVHPAPGNYDKTLVNALLYHCKDLSGIQGVLRPGIVHRLDKGTSGLLVVAKNDLAHNHLSSQLKKREIHREYHAITWGNLGWDKGTIEAPIGRALTDRKRMKVTAVRGREAVTEYEVLERFELCDLLRIKLKTGRTHQIRVHLSFTGHPVLGDPDYGGRQNWVKGISAIHRNFCNRLLKLIDRQALHAKKLGFIHPRTEEYVKFETKLPQDITDVLQELKNIK
jgi:23S rRNA pseudouridine1911/1915/1917 synthase